jgi:hypothetical protein
MIEAEINRRARARALQGLLCNGAGGFARTRGRLNA